MKVEKLIGIFSLAGLLFIFNCSIAQIQDIQNVNWGNAGYSGMIPDLSTNIINLKENGAVGDGITDDYNSIQTAITSATTPCVIYFPAGTYRINSQLNLKSGIVLRGDGYKLTHLEFESLAGCIQANGSFSGSYVAVTGGLYKGSNKLKVANASAFSVGNGGHFRQGNVIETTLTSWVEPRSPGQMFVITAINHDTLTIEPALNFDFESNPPLNPAYAPEVCIVRYIEQVGIEDLHIRRIHSDIESAGSNINISRAKNSWIRRVESEYTLKYHISVSQSLNLEIRDNYIHHARSRGDGGLGYGVSLAYQTTSTLVENNIFYECRHSMIIQLGVTGCVFGYNYAERNFSDDGWDKTAISLHGHYVNANLFEGNVVGYIGIGDYWGPDGPDNTFFRNRVLGTDRHAGFGDYRGIMYADFDGPQYIIGNEITGGSIYYSPVPNSQSDTSLVVIHGNNIKGTITWESDILDHTLPSSFYLTSAPIFFGNIAWPPFGGENPIGTGTIPALERRNSGNYIPPKYYYTITDTSICQGDSYFVGGSAQTLSGTYRDTLIATDGVDSVIITNLTVNLCSDIPDNFTLTDTIFNSGETGCFNALDTITVAGGDNSVEFLDGSSVSLIAEQSIIFLPGFHAFEGSTMNASITTDETFCDGASGSSIVKKPVEKSLEEGSIREKQIFVPGKKSIKVFPNPNNGQFTIELENFENGASICIYNMLGIRIHQSVSRIQDNCTINLPGLKRGIYVVRVTGWKEQVTKKITVN